MSNIKQLEKLCSEDATVILSFQFSLFETN